MTAAKKPERIETFSPRVLREYALLADGERGILIGPRGNFVWMCAPRWDSDAGHLCPQSQERGSRCHGPMAVL
jgi:hypothetical protein